MRVGAADWDAVGRQADPLERADVVGDADDFDLDAGREIETGRPVCVVDRLLVMHIP